MDRPLDRPFGYRPLFRLESADVTATVDRWRRSGFAVSLDHKILFPSLRLEIVPADRPVDALVQAPDDEEPGDATDHPNGVADLVAVGWATVELERFSKGPGGTLWEQAASDPHLGAVALRLTGPTKGISPVLLEPNTEGRLAATLVRHGEGPAALYFRAGEGGLSGVASAVRTAGGTSSGVRTGPFGPSILLLGGPTSGPHLVVVDAPSDPSRHSPEPGTIGR